MAQGDFGGKRNTGGFDKNPQNINRTGANRKSFAKFNEVLKSRGVSAAKKTEIVEFYSLIFNMTEDELKKIAQDKKQPHVLRAMILELNNPKLRAQAIRDYRDYMFGKAEETIQHNVDVYSKMTEEEIDAKIALMEKIKNDH